MALKMECQKLCIVVQEHENRMEKTTFEVRLLAVTTSHKSGIWGTDLRYVVHL